MMIIKDEEVVREGDWVLLFSDKVRIITRVERGKQICTIRGIIKLDDVIGLRYGSKIRTSLGHEITITRPRIDEIMLEKYERPTQVIYPKDAAYIILRGGVGPGSIVVESGCGSGFMTTFLAWYVRPDGRVISYDCRREFIEIARKNISMLGLDKYVEFRERDIIREGIDLPDNYADAIVLDMGRPWDVLEEAYRVLKSGRTLTIYVPSILQVERVLRKYKSAGFEDPEVVEILQRKWKPVPDELRPDTWMIAHTGFLVFLRKP
ncbi:MAG: tRNA (adenine-N1)-methyltransferase [Crenarchaeota archaeon]|nr:tRNA (adenine-N1)-methyltransferase [Thermoproteota archaeon]